MKQVNIQLKDEQLKSLRKIAETKNLCVSGMVRDIVDDYIAYHLVEIDNRFEKLFSLPNIGNSLEIGLSENGMIVGYGPKKLKDMAIICDSVSFNRQIVDNYQIEDTLEISGAMIVRDKFWAPIFTLDNIVDVFSIAASFLYFTKNNSDISVKFEIESNPNPYGNLVVRSLKQDLLPQYMEKTIRLREPLRAVSFYDIYCLSERCIKYQITIENSIDDIKVLGEITSITDKFLPINQISDFMLKSYSTKYPIIDMCADSEFKFIKNKKDIEIKSPHCSLEEKQKIEGYVLEFKSKEKNVGNISPS
ncbi:MAG: hypothetical protein UT24_C0019G0037 [Candidatus Woesebacteria bacterium GW2011_GWB1_39_12]|uniref:Uncharacterized protein n=1 Tax=Candidatus Woesebacteria bacterium GW2011_GWB1_39_12 TaxID=1618574 RepID=A0A0G0M9S0_9BACT|nr:MAG: hypothetical protein UT24_C0019G0037 [Candidatus Woesebacteria bacterium GW2011_GWB1_39_12]